MKLEEIHELWSKDSEIDQTQLSRESLSIPKIHHKYYRLYIAENLALFKLEAELKELKLAKYEFYTQGPSDESREKGWKLPGKGMILKAEVGVYLEADRDLIDLSLRIGLQGQKVAFLKDIIADLKVRNFLIKNAIEHMKFMNGQ